MFVWMDWCKDREEGREKGVGRKGHLGGVVNIWNEGRSEIRVKDR